MLGSCRYRIPRVPFVSHRLSNSLKLSRVVGQPLFQGPTKRHTAYRMNVRAIHDKDFGLWGLQLFAR